MAFGAPRLRFEYPGEGQSQTLSIRDGTRPYTQNENLLDLALIKRWTQPIKEKKLHLVTKCHRKRCKIPINIFMIAVLIHPNVIQLYERYGYQYISIIVMQLLHSQIYVKFDDADAPLGGFFLEKTLMMAVCLSVWSLAVVQDDLPSISSDRQLPERSNKNDRCMLTSAVNLAQLEVLNWSTRSSNVEVNDWHEDRWGWGIVLFNIADVHSASSTDLHHTQISKIYRRRLLAWGIIPRKLFLLTTDVLSIITDQCMDKNINFWPS